MVGSDDHWFVIVPFNDKYCFISNRKIELAAFLLLHITAVHQWDL